MSGNWNIPLVNYILENDNTTPKDDPASHSQSQCQSITGSSTSSSVVDSKDSAEAAKVEADDDSVRPKTVEIKQEHLETADLNLNESNENNANGDGQPVSKRRKIEVADAESNTMHTGMNKSYE